MSGGSNAKTSNQTKSDVTTNNENFSEIDGFVNAGDGSVDASVTNNDYEYEIDNSQETEIDYETNSSVDYEEHNDGAFSGISGSVNYQEIDAGVFDFAKTFVGEVGKSNSEVIKHLTDAQSLQSDSFNKLSESNFAAMTQLSKTQATGVDPEIIKYAAIALGGVVSITALVYAMKK